MAIVDNFVFYLFIFILLLLFFIFWFKDCYLAGVCKHHLRLRWRGEFPGMANVAKFLISGFG